MQLLCVARMVSIVYASDLTEEVNSKIIQEIEEEEEVVAKYGLA